MTNNFLNFRLGDFFIYFLWLISWISEKVQRLLINKTKNVNYNYYAFLSLWLFHKQLEFLKLCTKISKNKNCINFYFSVFESKCIFTFTIFWFQKFCNFFYDFCTSWAFHDFGIFSALNSILPIFIIFYTLRDIQKLFVISVPYFFL